MTRAIFACVPCNFRMTQKRRKRLKNDVNIHLFPSQSDQIVTLLHPSAPAAFAPRNTVTFLQIDQAPLHSCSRFVLTGSKRQIGRNMRVLGIDPGLRCTGWGVIELEGSRLSHIAHGTCTSQASETLAVRLRDIHRQVSAVVTRHQPAAAAIEQTFVNRDGAGTLKLGQARGVALLALAQAGLEPGEYAPNAVKKAVVGVGHAQKDQISHMVRLQLGGIELSGPDAADALAIAICHAHHAQSARAQSRVVA